MSAKKQTGGHSAQGAGLGVSGVSRKAKRPVVKSSMTELEAEDADDLAFVNTRIQAVKEGRSRIVSGQELQERLNRIIT